MRRRARRRALSMTSLIDVIFLLLLFFMLSSTFSRFSDVEMALAGPGSGAGLDGAAFLRLGPDAVDLNGAPLPLDGLAARLGALEVERLIVSVGTGVTAQRLTDLLVTLRAAPEVEIVLLGEG